MLLGLGFLLFGCSDKSEHDELTSNTINIELDADCNPLNIERLLSSVSFFAFTQADDNSQQGSVSIANQLYIPDRERHLVWIWSTLLTVHPPYPSHDQFRRRRRSPIPFWLEPTRRDGSSRGPNRLGSHRIWWWFNSEMNQANRNWDDYENRHLIIRPLAP